MFFAVIAEFRTKNTWAYQHNKGHFWNIHVVNSFSLASFYSPTTNVE